jgi:hypothetical protein
MIANSSEYEKALDELRYLNDWLEALSTKHTGSEKGMTKAGIRKMMARLHEELAVYEGALEMAQKRVS